MTHKPRLLLIDDNKILIKGLRSFLSKKYEVFTAYNGLDALNLLESNVEQFDIVITDLVMPVMSGDGVISHLKLQSPGTPIIAMTGWGKDPSGVATDAKADMVLMKPFDLDDLDRSITKLISAGR